MNRLRHGRVVAVLIALLFSQTTWADIARVVLLHTNDIHDHVRPGYDGVGGMPYVAGYVASVRAQQPNVLVLDAGDVTEKGDLVAFRSGRTMTYEAMRRIGYDGVTLGNHDNDAGLEALRRCEKALGQSILCLNRVDTKTGEPEFQRSRIVEVGGAKIGLIGMIKEQDEGVLSTEESGRALAREAARLRPVVDVLVAICHVNIAICEQWAREAPEIDLFVSGHQHKVLRHPEAIEGTHAWIVQAGDYARWVGRVELEIDLEKHHLAGLTGEVVEMRHDRVPVDNAMLAWVREREAALAPEASEVLFDNAEHLTATDLGFLAAEALRRAAGTDVGFCQAGQIIRSPLPIGPVDVNAVFLTGGEQAADLLRLQLTGAEIAAYLQALSDDGPEPANWAGFGATSTTAVGKSSRVETTLEPDRSYSAIMPQREWKTRFQRVVQQAKAEGKNAILTAREFVAEPSPVDYTQALGNYLVSLAKSGKSLKAEAQSLPGRDAKGS